MRKQTILLALGLFGLIAMASFGGCSLDQPDAPTIPITDEMVRVARPVVSIGNSLTAGFQNSGLVITGQLASMPNVLSALVSPVPGGIPIHPQLPLYMQMPLVASPGIGSTPGKTGLYVDGTSLQITRDDLSDPMALLLNAEYPLAYDDLGVPGATTADSYTAIDAGTSQPGNNSYFDLILRNSALPPFHATQLDQLESHFTRETIIGLDPDTQAPIYGINIPKIVTLWIGNNDLLGGVFAGHPVAGVNVTPASVWEGMFTSILNRVAGFAPDSQIVLGNIQSTLPYVTAVPLGTTIEGVGFVPWNTDEDDVQYILLSALSELDPPLGPEYLAPAGGTESIPAEYTLTGDEWAVVIGEMEQYNAIIAREAEARGWALADVDAMMLALPRDPFDPATYAQLNGVYPWLDMTQDGIPEQNVNSAFTLDGIHPSEKGYTAIANLFAESLNTAYGTSYAQADVGAVVNRAGFEQVQGGGAKPHAVSGGIEGISFTPQGGAGVIAAASLFSANR